MSPVRKLLTKLPKLSIISKVTCSPDCVLPGEGEVHVSWITLTAACLVAVHPDKGMNESKESGGNEGVSHFSSKGLTLIHGLRQRRQLV